MSQTDSAQGFWTRHDDPEGARERVRRAVTALTRARRLQLLIDHAWGGLLAGLCLATLLVLATRLVSVPFFTWKVVAAAVILALATGLLVGWRRRPGTLDVAIRADVALRLKQRLSTAWELMTRTDDEALAARLAAQAVKAGLPARPALVFPLRVNRWGRLAPLAAITLLLASIVDLPRLQAPPPRALDPLVMDEGKRLGAFGRAMQERAEREKLPRSTRQAAALERLGARMESGGLARSPALEELRRMAESLASERRQAQAEARPGGGAQGTERSPGAAAQADPDPAALERMQRGTQSGAEGRASRRRLDDLEREGIPRREIESALRNDRARSDDPLDDILEKLAPHARALKEDKELRSALEQVRRARDNLGDASSESNTGRGVNSGLDWAEDEREERGLQAGASASPDDRPQSATGRQASSSASQADYSAGSEPAPAAAAPQEAPSGPVLSAPGQMREGEMFSSEGTVLPRAGRPQVQHAELDAAFAPQVERVLSSEQYPAHYKEFVRRYFLTLSEGERPAPAQSPDKRGPP